MRIGAISDGKRGLPGLLLAGEFCRRLGLGIVEGIQIALAGGAGDLVQGIGRKLGRLQAIAAAAEAAAQRRLGRQIGLIHARRLLKLGKDRVQGLLHKRIHVRIDHVAGDRSGAGIVIAARGAQIGRARALAAHGGIGADRRQRGGKVATRLSGVNRIRGIRGLLAE